MQVISAFSIIEKIQQNSAKKLIGLLDVDFISGIYEYILHLGR